MHVPMDLGTILGGIWDRIWNDFLRNHCFLGVLIFYQFFKRFWNGFWSQLGVVLGRLGRLGRLLGCLGRVLGVSLGRLLGVLGASWLWGWSWDRFWTILGPFWERFGMVFDLSRHRFFINFVKVFFLAKKKL